MKYPLKNSRISIWYVFCFWTLSMCAWFSCVVPESSLADKKNYTENDNQYKQRYVISFEPEEKPIRYWYHYVVSSTPEGYRVRVFHPDKKTLIREESYTTAALTLLHGPYKSNWDDGSIRSQGFYEFGRKHGAWLESEPVKGKSTSGPYLNDKMDGVWTQLDTNGLIESVYTWSDGMRHGKFFEYDASGQKINEGIYRSDTLVSELFKRDRVQKPYLLSCRDEYIYDLQGCTEAKLKQQFSNQIRYPAQARQMGIEGPVLIQWDVMPNGSIRNMRVPQALSNEIEKECLRVFDNMGEWAPATKGGVPVKSTYSIPVQFKI